MLEFDAIFKSTIGRIVAFVLTPVLALAAPPIVNAVNEVLGTGYSDQQLKDLAIATIIGVALAAYRWLANRGHYEIAALQTKADQLFQEGNANLEQHPLPVAGSLRADRPGDIGA